MISVVGMGVILISVLIWSIFIWLNYLIVQDIIGDQIEGVVVGQSEQWDSDDGKVYFPIIEYQRQGITQQFQSTIYNHKPFVKGTQIRLIQHASSGVIERNETGRLFMGSMIVLFLALLWTVGGIAIVFPNFG